IPGERRLGIRMGTGGQMTVWPDGEMKRPAAGRGEVFRTAERKKKGGAGEYEQLSDIKAGRQGKAGGISDRSRNDTDAGIYERGDGGGYQGRRIHRRSGRDRHSGGAVKYLSSS